jgi:hypothetical protein
VILHSGWQSGDEIEQIITHTVLSIDFDQAQNTMPKIYHTASKLITNAMKYLFLLSLLISFNSQSQVSEQSKQQSAEEVEAPNQKRPSWSQGLPERQKAINPSATVNNFKINPQITDASTDDRSFEVNELPKVEIELQSTQPIIDFAIEVEPLQPVVINRKEAFEEYYNDDKAPVEETEVNPLIAAYKWTLLETTPIEVPDSFAENTTLKLKIYINPNGEVIRVNDAEAAIPRRVFKSAEKSILKWKFQAPLEMGITEDISRTFSIDIQTEA